MNVAYFDNEASFDSEIAQEVTQELQPHTEVNSSLSFSSIHGSYKESVESEYTISSPIRSLKRRPSHSALKQELASLRLSVKKLTQEVNSMHEKADSSVKQNRRPHRLFSFGPSNQTESSKLENELLFKNHIIQVQNEAIDYYSSRVTASSQKDHLEGSLVDLIQQIE